MNLNHIKARSHACVQIKRQQRDILDLQQVGIGTANAIALLERMQNQVDEIIGERNRMTGEARALDQRT